MISTREQVATGLAVLSEAQLRQVAEYLEFLEFRARRQAEPPLDDADLAALYGEFANEDRALAEVGLAQVAANLEREDATQ